MNKVNLHTVASMKLAIMREGTPENLTFGEYDVRLEKLTKSGIRIDKTIECILNQDTGKAFVRTYYNSPEEGLSYHGVEVTTMEFYSVQRIAREKLQIVEEHRMSNGRINLEDVK